CSSDLGVELLVERQTVVGAAGGGGHHGGTTGEEPLDDRRCDRIRRTTGDHGYVIGVLQRRGVAGLLGQGAQTEVLGLECHDLTGAGDIDIGGIQFAQGNAGEVLAGGGPAVIDLHHAVDI